MMRGRAVIEYMAEVYAGACATHFHPPHAVGIISMQVTEPSRGSKKLGHPVPLSNFVLLRKSVSPVIGSTNWPGRFSSRLDAVKGRLRALLESDFSLFRG